MGFSFQKARFVSDHLDEAARIRWLADDLARDSVHRQREAGHDSVR